MKVVGMEFSNEDYGYIKEWDLGSTAEIVPRLNGRYVTEYKCAYHMGDNSFGSALPCTLILGGTSVTRSGSGLGRFNSICSPNQTKATLGFRSSCVID